MAQSRYQHHFGYSPHRNSFAEGDIIKVSEALTDEQVEPGSWRIVAVSEDGLYVTLSPVHGRATVWTERHEQISLPVNTPQVTVMKPAPRKPAPGRAAKPATPPVTNVKPPARTAAAARVKSYTDTLPNPKDESFRAEGGKPAATPAAAPEEADTPTASAKTKVKKPLRVKVNKPRVRSRRRGGQVRVHGRVSGPVAEAHLLFKHTKQTRRVVLELDDKGRFSHTLRLKQPGSWKVRVRATGTDGSAVKSDKQTVRIS